MECSGWYSKNGRLQECKDHVIILISRYKVDFQALQCDEFEDDDEFDLDDY